jgi:hypothetical protein
MASTIIIKNGAGGSTPSSLKQGELAINVDSGSLYYGTSGSSNAVSSSFHIANLTASGDISSSGTIYGNNLDIRKDIDASAEIGRAHVGYIGHADFAGFSHVDQNGTSTYSLLQSAYGETYLNSKSGLSLYFRINNSNVGKFTSQGEFHALNGIDVTGHITASGNISSSGNVYGNIFYSNGAGVLVNSSGILTLGDAPTLIPGNITASGNISASGTITTDNLVGNGSTTLFAVDGEISASGTGSFVSLNITDAGVAKFNVDTNGHVSASGNISSSGDVITDGDISSSGYLYSQRAIVNRIQHNDGVSDIYFANGINVAGGNITASQNIAAEGYISASGAIEGNSFNLTANGDNQFSISSAGAVSASRGYVGNTFTAETNGVTFASIDATGNISGSGTGSFRALNITDDGAAKFNVDTNGHITASGTGSFAGGVESATTGSFGHLFVDGTINIPVLGADPAGLIQVNGVNYITGTTNDLNIGNTTKQLDLRGTSLRVTGSISASGDIAAEGAISSSALLSGTSLDIKSAGVTKAQIDAEGGVTASAYQGTKHLLYSGTIYINGFMTGSEGGQWDGDVVYLGNNFGNADSNWNDPVDIGSGNALGTTSTVQIAEDDTKWGMILPFDVSEIEVQLSLRPGGGCTGDNFFCGIYTAPRPDDLGDANYDITLVDHNDVVFSSGKYTSNDFTHTADIDKGTLIFIGIGSEDTTTAKNAPGILNVIITQR